MAEMDLEFSGKRANGEGVALTPRDVADALRLLNLLIGNSAPSSNASAVPDISKSPVPGDEPHCKIELARAIMLRRRRRARHFAQSMFGEPAWDIMLALYVSDRGGSRNTISRLAELSGAPMTTALRWLDYLEQAKLVTRQPSPTDRRVMFVELTGTGREKLDAYLSDIQNSSIFA